MKLNSTAGAPERPTRTLRHLTAPPTPLSLRLQLLQAGLVVNAFPGRFGGFSPPVLCQPDLTTIRSRGRPRRETGRLLHSLRPLAGAQALNAPVPINKTAAWLAALGGGEDLDFVHLGALARCWAAVGTDAMPPRVGQAILKRLEEIPHSPMAVTIPTASTAPPTARSSPLGRTKTWSKRRPHPIQLARSLDKLRSADALGAMRPANRRARSTPPLAQSFSYRALGLPVRAEVGDWILAQEHPLGGFLAAPGAPMPDLLSTATALHALACLDRRLNSEVHEASLDFIDTLWSARGGFHGQLADEAFWTPEYTFYGLLALGHLHE